MRGKKGLIFVDSLVMGGKIKPRNKILQFGKIFSVNTKRFFQVLINNGFTPGKDDYEFCIKVENMVIPSTGYFGISAATGGLAGLRAKRHIAFFCLLLWVF